MLASLESVIGPARSAGIPVFSNIPGCARAREPLRPGGRLLPGRRQGRRSWPAACSAGESPAEMPILYEVPPEFWINRVALEQLKGGWSFPTEIEAKADVVVEQKGPVRRHPRAEFAQSRAQAHDGRRGSGRSAWSPYSDATVVDEAYAGSARGLKEAGLVEGRDFTIDYRNAQGDIATLNSICRRAERQRHRPGRLLHHDRRCRPRCGRSTGSRCSSRLVLDPFAAGAGKSDADHRPNVTGVYLAFPYAEWPGTIREVLPKARRVGTLFTPGEVNSVVARQRFEQALKKQGLALDEPAGQRSDRGERRGARPSASRGSTSSARSRTA